MRHLLLLVVSLIAVVTIADAWCGTASPHGRGKATCMNSDCDTEAGRAPYYFTQGSSPILSFTVNSILFGDYYNDAQLNKNYNDSMAAFKAKYLSMIGIDLTIRSTFVSDEYQQVADKDYDLHKQMAAKYYRQGELTLMFSQFLNGTLYGYATFPWDVDTNNMSNYYAIITNAPDALSADNTTIFHEVGHMLGLLHVFNEDEDCSDCIERPSSPDRNTVGDFCNDTLPMRNENSCTALKYTQNCKGEDFASIDQLPVNNYMAYTTDSCQTLGFTPQQVARARCYLATKLTFLNPGTTPNTAGTPSTTGTPSGPNTATPSTVNTPSGKISAATSTVVYGAAAVVLAGLAMAL